MAKSEEEKEAIAEAARKSKEAVNKELDKQEAERNKGNG